MTTQFKWPGMVLIPCTLLLVASLTVSLKRVKLLPNKSASAAETGWVDLLDKHMSGWGTYLSYSHKPGYNGHQPLDDKGNEIAPVGYNKDPLHVFTMSGEQGQPVLHISGEIYGCIFTKQDYKNFDLKLKVKWGTKMFGPRIGKLKDSGVLYYSQGEAGVDYWRSWMLSQEFQIMEGHMGDYWNISNSAIDIRAYLPEGRMNSIANANQTFLGFGTGNPEGLCLSSGHDEKLIGEWNTIELICYNGKSLHIVNGHVVMVLQNSRYLDKGEAKPLTNGKIQLQSEGSEVYFKEVKIRKLTSPPEIFKTYFN